MRPATKVGHRFEVSLRVARTSFLRVSFLRFSRERRDTSAEQKFDGPERAVLPEIQYAQRRIE